MNNKNNNLVKLPIYVQKIILNYIILQINKNNYKFERFYEWEFNSIPLSSLENYGTLVSANELHIPNDKRKSNYYSRNNSCEKETQDIDNISKENKFDLYNNNLNKNISNLAFVCWNWFNILKSEISSKSIYFHNNLKIIYQLRNKFYQNQSLFSSLKKKIKSPLQNSSSLTSTVSTATLTNSAINTIHLNEKNKFFNNNNILQLKLIVNLNELSSPHYIENINIYIKQFNNLNKLLIDNFGEIEFNSSNDLLIILLQIKKINFKNIKIKQLKFDSSLLQFMNNIFNQNESNQNNNQQINDTENESYTIDDLKVYLKQQPTIISSILKQENNNITSINFVECNDQSIFIDLISNLKIKRCNFKNLNLDKFSFKNIFKILFGKQILNYNKIYSSKKNFIYKNGKRLLYNNSLNTILSYKNNIFLKSLKVDQVSIKEFYFILKLFPNLKYLNIKICIYSLIYKLTNGHKGIIKNCSCNDFKSIDNKDSKFLCLWELIIELLKENSYLKHFTITHICPANNYRNNCTHSNYDCEEIYDEGLMKFSKLFKENNSIQSLETSFFTSTKFLQQIILNNKIFKFHQTFSNNEYPTNKINKDSYLNNILDFIKSLNYYINYNHSIIM